MAPNQPRADNRHRMVRVEDGLWAASDVAAKAVGTTRAEVMREALQALVAEGWYSQRSNLVQMALWMAERGFSAVDVADMLETPWAWTTEWNEWGA